jgi:hypothetical protein
MTGMDFSQALARFIGRSVEAFQSTQLITGTLVGVSESFSTVQVTPNAYTSGEQMNVININIEYVRILPA